MDAMHFRTATSVAVGGAGVPVGVSIAPVIPVAATAIAEAGAPRSARLESYRVSLSANSKISIHELNSSSEEDLRSLMKIYEFSGDKEASKSLLDYLELRKSSISKLYELFKTHTRKEIIEIVPILLQTHAEEGNLEKIFILLNGLKGKISVEVIGAVFQKFTECVSEDIARTILLDSRAICGTSLSFAIREGAIKGHEESVRILLSGGRKIWEEPLLDAFQKASELGHEEVTRLLLPEISKIPVSFSKLKWMAEIQIDKLLNACEKERNIKKVETILDHLKLKELSKSEICELIETHAKERNIEKVQTFLDYFDSRFSNEELGQVVQRIAESVSEDIVRILLTYKIISNEILGYAVLEAAKKGHEGSARILLSEGRTISVQQFNFAVNEAAAQGHEEVIRFLLSDGRIGSKGLIEWAISLAARYDRAKAADFLLSRLPASKSTLVLREMEFAVRNNCREVFKVFLSHINEIPDENLQYLIWRIGHNGWDDVLILLLEKATVSKAIKEACIKSARNETIRHILRATTARDEESAASSASAGGGGAFGRD
jgi:hypothetical protein